MLIMIMYTNCYTPDIFICNRDISLLTLLIKEAFQSMTSASIKIGKPVIKLSCITKSMRKLKGVGGFLGSRPWNQELRFRKSKEIYREKVKTNLVEMTK